LAVITSTAAAGFEHRDGTYFCSYKFGGGIAYDEVSKQWVGTRFKPKGNFFVRLRYLKSRTEYAGQPGSYDIDDYLVFITDEGKEFSIVQGGCHTHDGKLNSPGLDEYGYLSCSEGLEDYKFNFKNNRFLRVYAIKLAGLGDDAPL